MHTAPKSVVPILDIAASIRFIIPPVEEELALKQEALLSACQSCLSIGGAELEHGKVSTRFSDKLIRTFTEHCSAQLALSLRGEPSSIVLKECQGELGAPALSCPSIPDFTVSAQASRTGLDTCSLVNS